ncbi:hypothetical protein JTE90_027341 [Oedothorax gibbosus]|uniref:Uncharacterized protein n=1 Tax=Oedothorax gibbosus TaxID=931172 RepID=A0AAV6W0M9_9ARAC|nr:hypothetical protein JTE90_027341 [Oedothorax gibbosus]
MPGHGYYSKLLKSIADHFEIGELFLEFIRFHCQDVKCDFFSLGWSGPPCTAIKSPYPDYSQSEFHYLSTSETPLFQKALVRKLKIQTLVIILGVGILSDTEDEYKDSDLDDVILDIGTSESPLQIQMSRQFLLEPGLAE